MILTKQTWVYEATTESEADSIVEDYKAKQGTEGFTIVDNKTQYKVKKDRKTGDVMEEKWFVTITVSYLI